MSKWEHTTMTQQGQDLLDALIAGTKNMNITRAVVGSDTVPATKLATQTDVTAPVQEAALGDATVVDGAVTIPVVITNLNLETGYTAKQIGIFAQAEGEGEILFFIAQSDTKGLDIPSKNEPPHGFTAEYNFTIDTGTASELAITVDAAGLVTLPIARQMIADHNASEDAHDGVLAKASHTHTPGEVGLGNVPNVATNDQTPTYTTSPTVQALTSGEKLSVAFNKIATAINHLINHLNTTRANPHGVTASQVGLGNVNNTSDANKPVSTAQATAIADAKSAGTTAQSNLNSHTGNKSNPHGVTAAQAGAVALAGDTMTGALNVRHKDGVMTFRPAADMNSSQPEHKNQFGIVANGNSVLNRWKWNGSAYEHLSAFYFGDKTLQLYNVGEGKTYSFYGEHYQARGFYSGKGNSSTFQHKIIGYGTLLIWSSKGICIVPMASTGDPAVALKSGSSSFYTLEQSVVKWDCEWLTLTKTAENTLNVTGSYYNYAIL